MDRRWKTAIIAAAVLVVGLGVFFFPAASFGFALIVVPVALFAIAIATKKPIWWFAAIAVTVIAGALFLTSRDSDDDRKRREDRAGQPTEQVEQRGLTTRTIEVGDQWQRVNFPPRHWFQLVPQRPIRLRMIDGREFTQNPGEDLTVGEVIPGFSVFLRSTLPPDSGSTKVVVSTWRKN